MQDHFLLEMQYATKSLDLNSSQKDGAVVARQSHHGVVIMHLHVTAGVRAPTKINAPTACKGHAR
jgi:hypothetical protein